MKKDVIRTKISKGPLIFTISGIMVSILIILLIIFLGSSDAFNIVVCIFMAIIALSGIILLFGELLDYAFIKDDELVMVYLFNKQKIKINDIGLMSLKEGVYIIFNKKNEKVGTINALLDGIDLLVITLDKKGVTIR